jgi:hypothetical protein
VKQQRQINKLDIQARQATIEALDCQKRGQPALLTKFVEITRQRQDLAVRRRDPCPRENRSSRLRGLTPKAQDGMS